MGGANQARGGEAQDERYARVSAGFAGALERLARSYEADPELRLDLLQDIHFALWRSFALFDEQCSERTWIYRVAHNVATSHMLKRRRLRPERLATLEDLAELPDLAGATPESEAGERQAIGRLMALVHALAPADRQVVLLYLEGLDAAAIGEVCGLTPGAVAMKIHRLKALLAQRFAQGGSHGG